MNYPAGTVTRYERGRWRNRSVALFTLPLFLNSYL